MQTGEVVSTCNTPSASRCLPAWVVTPVELRTYPPPYQSAVFAVSESSLLSVSGRSEFALLDLSKLMGASERSLLRIAIMQL